MPKVYPPSRVHKWTLDDLRNLIHKYVVVECWATEAEREIYGMNWLGGAGYVQEVGRRAGDDLGNPPKDAESGPVSWVLWDYGMGWQWTRDAIVYVSVCDSSAHDVFHDQNTVAVRGCLAQLGVRTQTLEDVRAKYGE